MASTQKVRMLVTKAQRWDEPTPQANLITSPSLQRSFSASTAGLPNPDPFHTSTATFHTPPPRYQEPPLSLRPLYLGSKDAKSSTTVLPQYPFQNAEIKDDQWSHLSRRKTSFWRTKKGIALVVLLSNVIIIAVVLGILFGFHHSGHRSQHADSDEISGENSQAPLSSFDPNGSLSKSLLPSTTSSTASTLPIPSPLIPPSPSNSVSMLPVFTPLPARPSGTPAAGGNGGGASSGGGQNPGPVAPLGGPSSSPSQGKA